VYNFESEYISGEKYFLRSIIKKIDKKGGVVIDIGANEGEFTRDVVEYSENLTVISFEPHPKTYKRVLDRFSGNERVKIINKGIGSKIESSFLYDYDGIEGSGHATTVEGVIEGLQKSKSSKYSIDLTTLDESVYLKNIQFIKIDIEGRERDALVGAKNILEENKVKYILLEFNEMNVVSKVFFKDIIELLGNYDVFRLLPGGRTLQLNKPYKAYTHELFGYQNIIFINRYCP